VPQRETKDSGTVIDTFTPGLHLKESGFSVYFLVNSYSSQFLTILRLLLSQTTGQFILCYSGLSNSDSD
jgi:hypothetical protein